MNLAAPGGGGVNQFVFPPVKSRLLFQSSHHLKDRDAILIPVMPPSNGLSDIYMCTVELGYSDLVYSVVSTII